MESTKRNTMRKPVKENNAVEKALMDGVGKWVNAFNAFPIPYEIDLVSLAAMVRSAYEEVATQPGFRVSKAHKGPLWEIEPSEKRVDDPGKFYPHTSSAYEKKKMHAYARFAGARFVLCGLLGGFAKAAALKGNLYFLEDDGTKSTILPDDLVVARATSGIWTGNAPKLLIATKARTEPQAAQSRPPRQQPRRLPPDRVVQGPREPVPSDRRERLETPGVQGESLSRREHERVRLPLQPEGHRGTPKPQPRRPDKGNPGKTKGSREEGEAAPSPKGQEEEEEKGLTSKDQRPNHCSIHAWRARRRRPRRRPCASGLGEWRVDARRKPCEEGPHFFF